MRYCKNCGKPETAGYHCAVTNGIHIFEPAEPEAAPAVEPVNTWARRNEYAKLVSDNGPRVDTRRVPFAPCEGLKDCVTKVECLTAVRCLKNLPEPTTQATEARKLIKLAEYIWNVRVTALEMPRLKDDFIRKVLQDLSEGIL